MAKSHKAECGHKEWSYGHCAEMTCSNYINKCKECSKAI